MPWLNIFGIAVGLAMDAFAVAVVAGLTLPRVTGRHVFRLAWHFGFFQFLMPVVGWLAGTALSRYVAAFDHWVAFGLLAFVGGKMIYEAFFLSPDEKSASDPTRGWTLLMLAIATSIDALAVGLTLAFLEVSIWAPAVVIGIVAAALTTVGICFGSRLGSRWQKGAEVAGGVILLLIGVRVLVSHICA